MQPFNKENIAEKELFEMAQKKVKKRKDFYIHFFVYVVGLTFWLLKVYTNLPLNFFPIRYINCFVMTIWTFIFICQAIELLISEVVLGKKWEDKTIKNLMEEKSEKQTWE